MSFPQKKKKRCGKVREKKRKKVIQRKKRKENLFYSLGGKRSFAWS